MKTRNKFQLFWLNRSNSWFKSKKRLFLVLCYWFSVQSESLPPGALADSQSESLPPGVPADLQSAVKKCSTTSPWGFAIPILFICISFFRQALWLILNQKVSRQAFQRICNPLSKNVRPLSPGDLQSPSSLFVFHSKTIARTTVIPFSCVFFLL